MHSVMEMDTFVLLILLDEAGVLDANGLLGSQDYFLV